MAVAVGAHNRGHVPPGKKIEQRVCVIAVTIDEGSNFPHRRR